MTYKIRIALDEKLEECGITRYALAKLIKVQYQTLDNYYKNKVTRYDSDLLLRICLALKCDIGDIIKIVPAEEKKN